MPCHPLSSLFQSFPVFSSLFQSFSVFFSLFFQSFSVFLFWVDKLVSLFQSSVSVFSVFFSLFQSSFQSSSVFFSLLQSFSVFHFSLFQSSSVFFSLFQSFTFSLLQSFSVFFSLFQSFQSFSVFFSLLPYSSVFSLFSVCTSPLQSSSYLFWYSAFQQNGNHQRGAATGLRSAGRRRGEGPATPHICAEAMLLHTHCQSFHFHHFFSSIFFILSQFFHSFIVHPTLRRVVRF